MTLLEALAICRRKVKAPATRFRVCLLCGSTAIELQVFLEAHLRLLKLSGLIEIEVHREWESLNSSCLEAGNLDALVVVLEWADLDPRLGIRASGGWEPSDVLDTLHAVRRRLDFIVSRIGEIREILPVCVSLPSLPLPPIFPETGWQLGRGELQLRTSLFEAASRLSECERVSVLNVQRLDCVSPMQDRFDARANLTTGIAYSASHADSLARILSKLIKGGNPQRKGLITDLDNTMWAGVVAEDGFDSISWDIDSHTQSHAIYQQLLNSLGASGTLIGVASKNDPDVVTQALRRPDLLLKPEMIFPIEAGWQSKSTSVSRILEAWNISADAVVFVDDNPFEIAEVKTAFPEMECLVYPGRDPKELWSFWERLRDFFGKSDIRQEDLLRVGNLRTRHELSTKVLQDQESSDGFLQQAKSAIAFRSEFKAADLRSLQLVNKTNQFNLNGLRFSEAEWLRLCRSKDSVFLSAFYRDKYGPLGSIMVLVGKLRGHRLEVQTWVLSCRAFSRRIEWACLEYLFSRYNLREIRFVFKKTNRNASSQGKVL